jgi:outer membrane protein assembly factor BamD (BamD/ComL family)
MMRWFLRASLLALCLGLLPVRTPAPLVYRPGDGWTWEPVGGAKWTRTRAKDQLEVATTAFEAKNYKMARMAAKRTVRIWPLSDYAPQAQFLVARTQEEMGDSERAFKAYQDLLTKYPKIENYDEVVLRQYEIANQFLAGKKFKLWRIIPYPSRDKTAELYEKVVKNGPYSPVGPLAQMNIGTTWENNQGWRHDYPKAVKAYERAADRYHYDKKFASDATYRAGEAYMRQAKTAEYDQSVSAKAIATFTDFQTLYPEDPRVADAQKAIVNLRTEQARGSYTIARYYEKKKRLDGALIYYNESVLKDPNSPYAQEARQRIEAIKAKQLAKAASAK